MALVADHCPNCNRITRCLVVEQTSIVGGVLLGIPLVLPLSSVTCICCECGSELRGGSWDSGRTVSPAEAGSLSLDALLRRTNPVLAEATKLSGLAAIPELNEALHLLDQLRPGRLRTQLKNALVGWSSLTERQQKHFLLQVPDCSAAFRFARSMTEGYAPGFVGCLVGVLGCVGGGAGCHFLLGNDLHLWGWITVVVAGAMAGAVPSHLVWRSRDRRWIRDVLVPEAQRAGVHFGWLLAILEDGQFSKQGEDPISHLCALAPTLRSELASSHTECDGRNCEFVAMGWKGSGS